MRNQNRHLLLGALAAALLLFAWPAHSAGLGDSFKLFVGANAVWLDGPTAEWPVDVEASGNAKLSLSPHISAVGDVAYGFANAYVRYDGGVRVTATDVNDPNYNLYLGIRYRGGSISAVQPSEWAPDAGIGWRPRPESWPNISVGLDMSYGLDSANSMLYAAVRYALPFNLFK